METPFTSTRVPNGVGLFVFGSYSRSVAVRDLDVLAVYDPDIIAHDTIYEVLRPVLSALGDAASVPVDLTVLTQREERDLRFVITESARPIAEFPELLLALH